MRAKTIAIAQRDTPKQVALWCESGGATKTGYRRIHVINGAWDGLFKDGEVIVSTNVQCKDRYPAVIVWEGRVPDDVHGYNEAMRWIEAQL